MTDATICDACSAEIPVDESQTCDGCGAVLCNECWALPACPRDKVIGYERHVAAQEPK